MRKMDVVKLLHDKPKLLKEVRERRASAKLWMIVGIFCLPCSIIFSMSLEVHVLGVFGFLVCMVTAMWDGIDASFLEEASVQMDRLRARRRMEKEDELPSQIRNLRKRVD